MLFDLSADAKENNTYQYFILSNPHPDTDLQRTA